MRTLTMQHEVAGRLAPLLQPGGFELGHPLGNLRPF